MGGWLDSPRCSKDVTSAGHMTLIQSIPDEMLIMFTVILLCLLLLFPFVDVWYFVRLALILIPNRKLLRECKKITKDELLKASSVEGIVLPFDLDLQFHMNNSKYLREMDFSRTLHYIENGCFCATKSLGGTLAAAATNIRYRKSLFLWQRFSVHTKMVCWDSDSIYTEQRFVDKTGMVCAVALLKTAVKRTTVEKILEKLGMDNPQSPPFPPEVQSWVETIARSKEKMKKERINSY